MGSQDKHVLIQGDACLVDTEEIGKTNEHVKTGFNIFEKDEEHKRGGSKYNLEQTHVVFTYA